MGIADPPEVFDEFEPDFTPDQKVWLVLFHSVPNRSGQLSAEKVGADVRELAAALTIRTC